MSSAAAWMGGLKSGQTLTRLLFERGAQIAAVVLLLLLGLDSALILTDVFVQPTALPPASASAASGGFHPTVNPALQLAVILNAHLFGTSNVTPTGEPRDTTMPLILAGVIADKDPTKGQAIIGENAGAAKLYAVGGAISGGAKLHAVYADYVLLERNGGLETLHLPRNPQNAHTGPPAPTPARSAAAGVPPNLMAGLVRVQPVFNQGKLNGYRIFPGGGKGSTAFTQLGLRPGDMIQAVNGTPLDDAGRAMEVLQTLSSSATATITVMRNGQSQEVNLNLAALNIEPDAAGDAAQPVAAPPEVSPAVSPGRSPPQRFSNPNLGAAPANASSDAGNISPTPSGADAGNATNATPPPERER